MLAHCLKQNKYICLNSVIIGKEAGNEIMDWYKLKPYLMTGD